MTEHREELRGLNAREAEERRAQGQVNIDPVNRSDSAAGILARNACTLFNLVNLLLALALALVGSWRNMLFMGVVLANLGIGVVQELRAKRAVDRLSLLTAARARVLRDGAETEIPREDVVLDDLLVLRAGAQCPADCRVAAGACEADESFLTGESEPVAKRPGDMLFAGSAVLSGRVIARTEAVGADTQAARVAAAAKRPAPPPSEIMDTLRRIITAISVVIFPLGLALFFRQKSLPGATLTGSVVSTAAALVGMIPEGLMLLTSTVLAVGVLRLSARRVLVRELYSIESLARVDVLCLDKTGTLTKGELEFSGALPLGGRTQEEIRQAMEALTAALEDENPTMAALRRAYPPAAGAAVLGRRPFSSAWKWSGAQFTEAGSFLVGAPDWLLPDMDEALRARVRELAAEGRVLLLAHSPAAIPAEGLPEGLSPWALFLLRDSLRPGAAETLGFFREQGVDIRVFSGDSPDTVLAAARQAGVPGADRALDASAMDDEALTAAARDCRVFGRVTPLQKKRLVEALREQGHTVAMTGDGINDVPALRAADCGIAMAAGTDAARAVARLVLLDSDFGGLPAVVAEGRRCIHNIQRSASLFLVKTIYAAALALLFLLLPWPYPFIPIQMTLINAACIGIPSFILALEPSRGRVRGRFLRNVLRRAVPGALTTVAAVLAVNLLGRRLGWEQGLTATFCALATGLTGLWVVFAACLPFNLLRGALFCAMALLFGGAAGFFGWFFDFTPLSGGLWGTLAGLACATAALYAALYRILGGGRGKPPADT